MKKIPSYIILCLTFCISSSAFGLTTFSPSLSVKGENTDNLYLSNNNRLSDFILIPSADLELAMTDPTKGVEISYNPSYSFYQKYSENNAFRQGAGLNLWTDLARATRFEITDSFLRTEDPLSEEDITLGTEVPLPEQDTTIRTGRRLYYSNRARAALTHRFGQTDSLSLAYDYSILENIDPEVEDNKRYSPSVVLTYWFNQKWGTETKGTFEKGDFETSDDFDNTIGRFRLIRLFTRHFQTFVEYTHTIMDFKGESEDYKIYEPSVGIGWSMDEDSKISLAAGYYIRDMEHSDSDTGFTVNGDIGKRWTFRRSSISLTGSSGYNQAYFGSENLGFSKFYQIAGSGRYEFTRHLSGGIFGSYRHTKYEDLMDQRKDKAPTIGCNLNYQITQWLLSRLTYTYRAIDSTDDESEYEENRIMLIISVSSAQPYRL